MAIPDFQTVMLPILQVIADGRDHLMRDVTRQVADHFGLSADERAERLPSGQQTIISNRVAWAKTHMKMAGLLENPARGFIRLSPAGRQALAQKPGQIDLKFLRQYPSYVEFTRKAAPTDSTIEPQVIPTQTPKELIDEAYKSLKNALAKEVLERVKASSPRFFEDMVVKLLVAMGYGGSLADAGKRIVGRGDGGIDGIINEDRLGLDVVCIQAKRWESTVGRPVVQGFVGSMDYHRARKGVLVTTSGFSSEALDYVNRIEGKKVVLIDGETLAELMIDTNVGVSVADTYLVKRVDFDFFNEDEE